MSRVPRASALVVGLASLLVACARDHAPRTARAIDSAFAVAESTYWRGKHDSARAAWTNLLSSAESSGDSVSMGRAVAGLATVAWRQADYSTARRLGERGMHLPLRPADRLSVLNALGLSAYNEGRFAEAIPYFDRAITAAREARDPIGEAKAIMNWGLSDMELGRLTDARQRFTTARVAARAAGDTRVEGKCLNNLGALEIQIDPLLAIAHLDTARTLYRQSGYSVGQANALGQLGLAYAAIGEPQRAIVFLDSALAEARRLDLPQEEASDLQLLAEQYAEAGDYTRALDYLTRAQTLNASLGMDDDRATAIRDAAEVYLALGQRSLALRHAREALEIHRKTDSALEQLVDLLLLARIYERDNRTAAVDSTLDAARDLAARRGTRDAHDRVALAVAEVADRSGTPRAVLAALDPPSVGASPPVEGRMLALRARAYRRLDMLDSASAVGERAVRAVERVRGRYASGALRTAYAWENADVYADLVLVLLRQGRIDDAFTVADAARGRALMEHLTEARNAVTRSTGAARELADGEALLRYIDELVSRLRAGTPGQPNERSGSDDNEEADLAARITRARNDYEALLDRAAERDAAGAAVLGARKVGTAAVRSALHANEALLEYFVSPDRVLAFAVTADSVRAITLGLGGEQLASRVRLARELLGRGNAAPGSATAVLTSLYDELIAPVRRAGVFARVRRVVIVPHGPLVYLPFAALRDQERRRYLVEDFTLLYAPSAAAFAATRTAALHASVDRAPPVAMAPFPGNLPRTAIEAERVAQIVGHGVVLRGSAASEGALRRALATASLVHVATHAELNLQNPMFSQIALAPVDQQNRADDGRLEVHELLGMHVESSLVFLSGCETGLGAAWSTTFRRGEDFTTLAQAFLYAGARSVVATLWRIEDGAAAVFAERFYEGLRDNAAPEALAAAQRAMLRDPRYAAPYDWAAYTITGDAARGPAVATGVR